MKFYSKPSDIFFYTALKFQDNWSSGWSFKNADGQIKIQKMTHELLNNIVIILAKLFSS